MTITLSVEEALDISQAKIAENDYSPEFVSDMDLISIFKPRSIIKENISLYSDMIKEANSEYDDRLIRLMSIKSISDNKEMAELAAFILWTAVYEPIVDNAQKQLLRLDRLKRCFNKKNNNTEDITHDDIIKAKSVPIDSLIQFDRMGLSRCIWHNDRNPSLKLYKQTNRCWCFSCNQGGDAIDITRQTYEVDFIQAVKKLINR